MRIVLASCLVRGASTTGDHITATLRRAGWLRDAPGEPAQRLVGDLAPAVVDGQGVAAVVELPQVGDGW